MSEEEWGPWIEHDGMGCPCVGRFVEVEYDYECPFLLNGQYTGEVGKFRRYIASNGGSWNGDPSRVLIIRYRIRKPKGLTILEGLIAEIKPRLDA